MPDYKSPGTFAGDVKFGDAAADAHQFTGSVYISGAVYATQHIVDSVTTTVTNLYQQGSTKLGDTADDIHEMTGSFYLSGTFADPNTTGQMFEVRGGMGEEGNPTVAHAPILTVSGTSDGSVTWPMVSVNTTAVGADRSTFRVKAAAANNAVVSVFAVDDGKLFRIVADPDNDCSLQLYNTSNVVKTLIHTNGDTYFNGGDVIIGGTVPNAKLTVTGDVYPGADNAHNLGSDLFRWANVFTGDLHLKNDRGDWTVVEESEYLAITNNKNGKKYKLLMEEVED